MDPVLSAVLLGFVLGLQHATDPDHVVAVATIVTREGRFAAGARVGLLWGLGHSLTLVTAGMLVIAVNAGVPGPVATGFELVVAVMLVTLGAVRLRDAVRGIVAVAPERRVADHHQRALLVGAVHGMAGTAAVALLVLATLDTIAAATVYLIIFGLGTIAGMTALTAAMAYPVARLARLRRMREAMAVASGVAAIAFGCWYAARLV
jgi:nickel/cobalt exporter